MKTEAKEVAERFNEGKPELSFIDLDSMMDTADVFSFGAKKYSRDNWKKGQSLTQVLDSMMRHIAGLQRGEFFDPESGLPHIGHIGCNMIFVSDTLRNHPELIEDERVARLAAIYYKDRKYIPHSHEK